MSLSSAGALRPSIPTQRGKDSSTVGNGTYLLKRDSLRKRIRNRWGEEIDVQVLTTQEAAKEAIRRVHGDLGHLGTKNTMAALRTPVSIPYAQELVERTLRTYNHCQFAQREPAATQPLHLTLRVHAGFVTSLPKRANAEVVPAAPKSDAIRTSPGDQDRPNEHRTGCIVRNRGLSAALGTRGGSGY